MFVHTIFFWLKEDAPSSEKDALVRDCFELLGKIPSVRHVWAGAPAMTPRDVVDNSYHAGLTVVLDDIQGHDIYQEHSLHLEFLRLHKAHWARLKVYDFNSSI